MLSSPVLLLNTELQVLETSLKHILHITNCLPYAHFNFVSEFLQPTIYIYIKSLSLLFVIENGRYIQWEVLFPLVLSHTLPSFCLKHKRLISYLCWFYLLRRQITNWVSPVAYIQWNDNIFQKNDHSDLVEYARKGAAAVTLYSVESSWSHQGRAFVLFSQIKRNNR